MRLPLPALFSATVLLLTAPVAVWSAAPDVEETVRQGVAHYAGGDYPAAADAFREADVARPDDPWITFDMATVYAARGDVDRAVELFSQASLSRETGLAVRCHYNLGTLVSQKARLLFGENPVEATPEVRQEGLQLLAQAVSHYRDCIDLDDTHADARHNLETIRLWIKHMEALWAQRDRQKQRDEMNLLEFLAMIETQQRGLRLTAKSFQSEPDSPKRRQALDTLETSQRSLVEEIEPLKEKISQSLQPPQQQQPGATPGLSPGSSPPQADISKAIELLGNLADEAGAAMNSAADRLAEQQPSEAVQLQTEAIDRLDQIYLGVVPFANLVGRAISTEQGLIDLVSPAAESANREPPVDEPLDIDLGEAAWNQGILARWAELLGAKASQQLKQLEAAGPDALGAAGGTSEDTAPGTAPGQGGPDPEAMQQQIDGVKKSMEKAVELGPEVNRLTTEAAADLGDSKPAEALPKQQQALKLLKEIADPLPKQDQQQQGDEQQEDSQQDQQEQNPSDNNQQDQQKRPQQQPRDLSQQQAEAVLRKVRERSRERRELEKQLQQYLARPGMVERDW